MAVYQRAYRPYEGELTPPRLRFLVVTRYALRAVFASRLFTAFFALALVWPLVCAIFIYLRHNTEALALLRIRELVPVDGGFFLRFVLQPLGAIAFVMALVVGPALVSPDLRNNALPLYLSRSLRRVDYVGGKFAALAALLSAVTWVPGLLLFLYAARVEGAAWLREHLFVAPGVVAGFWLWIALLALLALALSAWLKWKPLARLLFLGVFFLLQALGAAINFNLRTDWGTLFELTTLRDVIWESLLRQPASAAVGSAAAWGVLGAVCAVCVVLLARKVRAVEVVS